MCARTLSLEQVHIIDLSEGDPLKTSEVQRCTRAIQVGTDGLVYDSTVVVLHFHTQCYKQSGCML